ncbi:MULTISPECIES: hypothetical protein [Roseobacteraceae]|uniref:Uncharacterized protein n=1 Tax=Celeribacter baekdonensis B30 TaxID=1208323 RepID=K2K514_9RHOB|nr:MULTISPECIES: hypothetical protein [Roseobacteraceae]EKE72575.1 hypothetical protein B30_06326 [Celeribacter baekdonensis B30]KAB6714848.1 hypothetical protein C8029_18155 [Roseobacter sp. TSBP12]|tara:strand:- start:6453 stop:6785 length:333 start_codon:yes stop_codon:yes gene_type:complete
MKILNFIAYVCWGLAGIFIIIAIAEPTSFMLALGLSVSLAISGVLFFSFSKVIFLLEEIRDSITGSSAPSTSIEQSHSSNSNTVVADKSPTRTIEEISKDLEEMKKRVAQ